MNLSGAPNGTWVRLCSKSEIPARSADGRLVVELEPRLLGLTDGRRDSLPVIEVGLEHSLDSLEGGALPVRGEHPGFRIQLNLLGQVGRQEAKHAFPEVAVGLMACGRDGAIGR